ncbi:uncharacterized protein LOC120334346 [Styela clava]|uniref:uncharacterized protein LOC120334346 n=1 Tax=Styela clava TaxID=7725 RepID=UPI00193A72D5|nr:uncharacterized protein LOC120334346 [Styela clava]
MKTFILSAFFALIVVCIDETLAHTCNDVILQEDVDYSRLRGEWWQAYHTRDSHYSQFECFDMRIFGVSKLHKLFYVQETIQESRPKMGTIQQILFSTMCWENCVSEREIHVNGHIATDYDTYMIIHTCVKGHPVIDVEVRKEMNQLPPEKVREVSQLLEKIGVNFFSLQERDRSVCPTPKR